MVVFIQRYTMPIVKIRLNKLQGATLSDPSCTSEWPIISNFYARCERI